MPRARTVKDPFVDKLHAGLQGIMADEKASVDQKLKAIEIGVKLLAAQHKIKDDDDAGGMFPQR